MRSHLSGNILVRSHQSETERNLLPPDRPTAKYNWTYCTVLIRVTLFSSGSSPGKEDWYGKW